MNEEIIDLKTESTSTDLQLHDQSAFCDASDIEGIREEDQDMTDESPLSEVDGL